MTTISDLPPAPQPTDDTATFNTKAFAILAAWQTMIDEQNAQAGENNTAAATATTGAATATTKAAEASAHELASAANATAAASSAGAIAWVSGTTYAVDDARKSPIDHRVYSRLTNGAGTTDPSADPTNWEPIAPNGLQLVIEAGTSAAIAANTDTAFTNAAACAATVPAISVGASFVARFDNGRLDNTVDLGARSMIGPNGQIRGGVITLNTAPLISLRWWGDYYRSN
ncbi:MAG: hypothetical protein ACT6S0_04935 [Roseateles sp.]|uniref:hypothetical protein n=1 Tax=Roseateles sp. TaxID=1971397 RepID=UPI0040368F13